MTNVFVNVLWHRVRFTCDHGTCSFPQVTSVRDAEVLTGHRYGYVVKKMVSVDRRHSNRNNDNSIAETKQTHLGQRRIWIA